MKLCFLMSHSPYGSTLARDALDMALASAAFDQQVSLLFIGDGVFQLAANQHSDTCELKNIEKTLSALELYDIQHCYACEASITERNLSDLSSKINIQRANPQAIEQIIAKADQVMSF